MTTMKNPYISQGILEDCHNDMNVLMRVREHIDNAIKEARTLKECGAMAYNGDVFDDIIDNMDDSLWHTFRPINELIEEGINYHEAKNDCR